MSNVLKEFREYKAECMYKFRKAEPRFIALDNEKLSRLYGEYSEQTACAGWLFVTDKVLEEFIGWVFETPFERIQKEAC